MSAEAKTTLMLLLAGAQTARAARVTAETHEREAVVKFMDEAMRQHLSWDNVGSMLGISGTAARRYYARNRPRIRVGGGG